jgi:predicted transcriptional regulator
MSVKESDQQDGDALELLHELLDNISYRIILSTIGSARSVGDICSQNNIPLSSTYKKIKRLTKHGLIHVARIEIDDSGKKVVFYKSQSEENAIWNRRRKVVNSLRKQCSIEVYRPCSLKITSCNQVGVMNEVIIKTVKSIYAIIHHYF